jgi:hypothetical protein
MDIPANKSRQEEANERHDDRRSAQALGSQFTVEFHEGDATKLDFADASFDCCRAISTSSPTLTLPNAGINRGLGLHNAFYHFAFEAGRDGALEQKRQ